MALPSKQGNYNDPQERERLLATYAGIFPNNWKEYGEILSSKIHKKRKNFSK